MTRARTRTRTGTRTGLGQDRDKQVDLAQPESVLALEVLRTLASDPTANAHARASAARTVAEIQGLIGKHSVAPDRTGTIPIGELSRSDLTQELTRLRARCLDRDLSGPGPGA
jgi:hypothetical protein